MENEEIIDLRKTYSDILDVIVWSEISQTYFDKSGSWIYHKMRGVDGNGVPKTFTDAEKEILKSAFLDISEKLKKHAEELG